MSAFRYRYVAVLVLLGLVCTLGAMVPPHPKRSVPENFRQKYTEPQIKHRVKGLTKGLPNHILVFRVQFTNRTFKTSSAYPDFLDHDEEFFERWMVHLKDFCNDASHTQYNLSWYMYPEVITLQNTIEHYGTDTEEYTDASLEQMIADIVQLKDSEIDFSLYGGIIIFHAGAGQETDIGLESNNFQPLSTNSIWSTIITRKDLQRFYDPENDDYPGYPTNDGIYLTNIGILPEDQFHDYFPVEGENLYEYYLFSLYGVLTHQFGRMLGLPSLFDTNSANGKSQGIGNWGLMGTGIWNANGYVPAQLSAYSRMVLGWEQPISISSDATGLGVDHFLNHNPEATRLYKIPISENEYFLIENRQQNPDNSTDPHNWQPSYTFELLPEGEQEYYPAPDTLRPYFNFMKNRYGGCEWDFFLPGYGGPIPQGYASVQDGSGLMIWHIDENIINETFTENFDANWINGDASHKGVDLEEADGIQHLDISTSGDMKYGSPYDAFRDGNNVYFGNQTHNGLLSLPTAQSYYGGIPLEIYDISNSALQMSFSVRFNWRLDTGYQGSNPIGAAAIDFDGKGSDYIFYPMPSGELYLWKDELLVEGFPAFADSTHHTYVWDGSAVYLPVQSNTIARLYRLRSEDRMYLKNFSSRKWASHPVARKLLVPDSGDPGTFATILILPLNSTQDSSSELVVYDPLVEETVHTEAFGDPIVSNLCYAEDGKVYGFTRNSTGSHVLFEFTYQRPLEKSGARETSLIWHAPEFPDSTIVSIARAKILPSGYLNSKGEPKAENSNSDLIVQTPYSVYLYNQDYALAEGFPYLAEHRISAPLSLADTDKNGTLDIILGGENGFTVIDYSATKLSSNIQPLGTAEASGTCSGVLALDVDNDGKVEYLGNFSRNRFGVWEDNFRLKYGYPVSFGNRSRSLPFISRASDDRYYAWLASDSGSIFRSLLPNENGPFQQNYWFTEYGDLMRSASMIDPQVTNQFQTDKVFVPGEVYIYPNPLNYMYPQALYLNVMTSMDTEIDFKIFDIRGSLVYSQKSLAKAYLRNREVITIPAAKMNSGVYIAVVSAGGKSKTVKFAIEK
ncbi:MAG: T9SS type A sorting domain-containing protein [Candidatus Cloacimonetes bacterium]|nr:T9SS type A sorting domain-containing protein [Candidatus Cloacimonadota bacterium]